MSQLGLTSLDVLSPEHDLMRVSSRRFIARHAHAVAHLGGENKIDVERAVQFGEGARLVHEVEQGLKVRRNT